MLTPWSRVLQLVKKFPTFYGTRRLPCSKELRPCVTFSKKLFFLWSGVISPLPNPQAVGPPFVSCPRLLVLYYAADNLLGENTNAIKIYYMLVRRVLWK
jgi:hypothetical protein